MPDGSRLPNRLGSNEEQHKSPRMLPDNLQDLDNTFLDRAEPVLDAPDCSLSIQ